jgi:hypothetical protein
MVTLWHGTSSEGPRSFSIPLLALHGILLGFAYLTRYTALILFPISLIYLFLLYRRSPRQMFLAWVLVSMPFLVTTSMQLIPSWRVHRNPFYSEQAKNVWFGIYGGYDWVNNWGKVPDTIRLTEVIAMDPARFLQHWLRQLSSAFVSLRLWPLPFHIAWILAVPELLLSRQLALPRRLLLLMVLLFPLGVTALAWLWPRLLLVSLWVEAVLVGWLVFRLKDVVSLNDRVSGGISGAILILAAIVLQWPAAADWLTTLPITRPREVNEFLRMAGMEDAGETATNDPYLHAVDEPTRTRYAQAYSVNPNPKTVEALLTHPSAADWEYLVMDYEQGFGQYAPLRDSFRRAKPFLVPLALSDQRDVYCIMPCLLDDVGPLALSFDSGMQLVGYRWRETRRQGSLYLHWQTEDEITLSYRVLLRVINASGDEVAQIDTIPQSGTFPTTAWPTDTPVIDFYSWPQENACEGCQISLLVYDESSLEPLLATTEAGQRVGPLINLHQSPNSRSK